MRDRQILFAWREAILSEFGPKSPVTRYVLLALSTRMELDGSGAFPSESTLAKMTGMTRRTIIPHLKIAESEGWINRRKDRRKGQMWHRYTHYQPRFPVSLEHASPPNKVKDVHLVGTTSAEAEGTSGNPDKVKDIHLVTDGSGGTSANSAPSDKVNLTHEKVNATHEKVNDVHTTSSIPLQMTSIVCKERDFVEGYKETELHERKAQRGAYLAAH